MKALVFLYVMSLSAVSFADDFYKCFFTEPFINVSFYPESNFMIVKNHSGNQADIKTYKTNHMMDEDLTLAIPLERPEDYLIVYKGETPASDGMSDKEYEFEGVLRWGVAYNLIGGCDKLSEDDE